MGWRDAPSRASVRGKSLTLRTERTFRTDEKARGKLVSRNVPKLRVRVYKLDVETFVRATLGLGDVANLAIEVISPDQSFDSAVHEYQPHKETEPEVEPGAREGAGAKDQLTAAEAACQGWTRGRPSTRRSRAWPNTRRAPIPWSRVRALPSSVSSRISLAGCSSSGPVWKASVTPSSGPGIC